MYQTDALVISHVLPVILRTCTAFSPPETLGWNTLTSVIASGKLALRVPSLPSSAQLQQVTGVEILSNSVPCIIYSPPPFS